MVTVRGWGSPLGALLPPREKPGGAVKKRGSRGAAERQERVSGVHRSWYLDTRYHTHQETPVLLPSQCSRARLPACPTSAPP